MTDSKNAATAPEQGKLIPLTPGAMLREARENVGQTHAAVGEALHLTVHYIKALENDDYSKLPGLIFVKGYIRSYGHYLKMDVDALIRSYDSHVGSVGETTSQNVSSTDRRQQNRRRNDQSHGWALVAGFIVVVALGAGWWFVGREPDTARTASTTPSAAQLANNAAAAASTNTTTPPVAATSSQTGNPFNTSSTIASTTNSTAMQPAQNTLTMNAPAPDASTLATPQGASITAPVTAAFNTTVTDTVASATTVDGSTLENALPTADVTRSATAIAPTGEVIESAATTEPQLLQTTVSEDGITVIPAADGSRQISMFRDGNDELQLRFAADSWVEIDDGTNVRVYSDMLNAGDTLTIQGTAPFQVLLGNARNVEVSFNNSVVDIAPSIRSDNTARVQLSNPGTEAPVTGTGVAQ